MKTSEIKANRQLWYDELMSGKHEQTMGALQDAGGKCCLGVACYLAFHEGIIEGPYLTSRGTLSYAGNESGLPPEVQDWLGFEDGNPLTRGQIKNVEVSFSELNDNEKMNFEEIAAILKRDFIDPLEKTDDTST